MHDTVLIRIVDSLSGSPIASLFDDLILHVRSPRSETSVTLSVNSGLLALSQQFSPQEGEVAPEVFSLHDADQAQELYFDVSREPRHRVRLGGVEYEILLLRIGHVGNEQPGSPWYEFQVTKHAPNIQADKA